MGWLQRLFNKNLQTIAALATESGEFQCPEGYPTRVWIENTTDAPTELGVSIESPLSESATFIGLDKNGDALAITVTPGKWNSLSPAIADLIGANRFKFTFSAWTAGGRMAIQRST